jgi:hypothetical protein
MRQHADLSRNIETVNAYLDGFRKSEMPEPGAATGYREWAILDSNQGPRPYQRRALTS